MLSRPSAPDRRHVYHPQLRRDVWRAQDPWLYSDLDIPRSTRLDWRNKPPPDDIVGAALFDRDNAELRMKIDRLQRRNAVLWALVRVLFMLVRVLGADLRERRLPNGRDKTRVLRAVERSADMLGLAPTLRLCGLSSSRYHEWKDKRLTCTLDDRLPCPRRFPTRLAFAEVSVIGDMVLDATLRHMSTAQLALYAQRLGRLFASASTWYRYMRERGWKRPLVRLHFPPKEGIRASARSRKAPPLLRAAAKTRLRQGWRKLQ